MKPHIRVGWVQNAYRRWWICLTSPTTYYKGGIGATPQEAYKDWERQNVDQNS